MKAQYKTVLHCNSFSVGVFLRLSLQPLQYSKPSLLSCIFAPHLCKPSLSPLPTPSSRPVEILTRSSSTLKGTFPVRCLRRLRTAPPCWRSSTGGRFTPAGFWEAGGSSTSTPTTRAASTCWRKASTANRWTGALSAPLYSLFEG